MNRSWCIDGDFAEFDKGMTKRYNGAIKFAIKQFFEISASMIEIGGFDIVG